MKLLFNKGLVKFFPTNSQGFPQIIWKTFNENFMNTIYLLYKFCIIKRAEVEYTIDARKKE